MAIRFLCKNCEQLLSIAARKSGSVIDCPECGEPQTVPNEQDAATAMAMSQSYQADEIDPVTVDSPFVVDDDLDINGLDSDQFDRAVPNSADEHLRIGRVLVKRETLFAQAVLLTVLPVVGLALGYFLGRWDANPAADATVEEPVREEVLMQGKIVWEPVVGEIAGDEGAVVIVLPSGEFPGSTLSIQGLRPQDPHPSSDHKGFKKIQELGGLYARVDASGLFPLVFPDSGGYRVLLISRNTFRPQDTPIDEGDLEQIKRYFIHADLLIGRYEYRWSTEEITQESPPIEHSFGRTGQL